MRRVRAIGRLASGIACAILPFAVQVAAQPPAPQAFGQLQSGPLQSGAVQPGIATGAGAVAGSGDATPNAMGGYEAPRRWTTNQFEFTIPIIANESLPEDQRPIENQLYLSSDRGVNWTLSQREPPTAERFSFAATHEGEFWFALRTRDREGRLSPVGPLRAELVVTIDTTPPKLELSGKQNDEGQLEAVWNASDDRLAPQSFKIEALIPGEMAWRPLALAQPGRTTLTTLDGIGRWNPPTGLANVQLRAEILDLAGNRTVATETLPADLPMPPQAAAPPATASTEPASSATAGTNAGAGVGRFASNPTMTGSSFPQIAPSPADPATAAANGASARGTASGYPPPPPIGGEAGSSLTGPPPIQAFPLGASPPAGAPSSTTPPAPLPTASGSPAGSPAPGGVSTTYPSSAGTFGAPAVPTDGARQSPLPPGERPLMTNKRTFNLDYDLDRVDVGSLADVELWATRDGGRSWQKWGTDADVRSPFPVTVEAEGMYGFRIVVVSKNGLASPSPRSGEPADVWVGVDWTAPRARIAAAPFAEGPQAGQLRITWDASDDAFGERPIGLFFSSSPDGPWQSIAQGLPDAGEYFWKIDPRAPNSVYLKIDVTDAAGNVGSDKTLDPIDLRGLVPTGRIRGLSAAPEASAARTSSWLPTWLQWR